MKNTDKMPSCYGRYTGEEPCGTCEYSASCRYYTATAPRVDRNLGFASIELVQDRVLSLADPRPVPGELPPEPGPEPRFRLQEVASLLRYLLDLDTYTLEILREVLVPGTGRPCTVADLSRLRKISRQSMHRKLLRILLKHPELGELLYKLLGRMPPRCAA